MSRIAAIEEMTDIAKAGFDAGIRIKLRAFIDDVLAHPGMPA